MPIPRALLGSIFVSWTPSDLGPLQAIGKSAENRQKMPKSEVFALGEGHFGVQPARVVPTAAGTARPGMRRGGPAG